MKLSSYAPLNPVVRLDPHLHGRTLILAQFFLVAASALTIGLLIAALPIAFDRYQSVCTAAVIEECGFQLPPEGVQRLQALGLSPSFNAAFFVGLQFLFAAGHVLVAALVLWRKPSDRIALFVALFLVTSGAGTSIGAMEELILAYPAWSLPVRSVKFLGEACLVLFFFLFPDGRFVPHWTRWLAPIWLAVIFFNKFFPSSPLASGTWPLPLALGVVVALSGSCILAQVYRYHRVSDQVQRQQTKWVVFGVTAALGMFAGLVVVGESFPAMSPQPGTVGSYVADAIFYLIMLLIPLSIGVAVLRFRLWDIDPIINRTLVYGALTASVIGLYVLVVGGLGALLQAQGSLALSLLATGLVAVMFQPLRDRLQKGVNRMMYGKRDEPYAVVSQLGQRLEATLAPEAVLPTIVETVASALKLPYAAIAVRRGDDDVMAAAFGTAQEDVVRLPLMYQNERVGELLLALRAAAEPFSPADRSLLSDLARQAGVAVHAVRLTGELRQLTGELQRARTGLVTAREEERRRLRRDLHDGLGSVLASLNFRAGAIRTLLTRDPAAADALVLEQQETIRSAIADIRRLVHGLRPPALDELGLVAAIREQASQRTAHAPLDEVNRLQIDVVVAEPLPALPAAAEVAAYRIVQEALTNVVHHARARCCQIKLAAREDALWVEISDDGVGLPEVFHTGVGLISMRERAEELGGSCIVERLAGRGARVCVVLPLVQPHGAR